MQDEKNPLLGLPKSAPETKRGQTVGRPDIRGDAITPALTSAGDKNPLVSMVHTQIIRVVRVKPTLTSQQIRKVLPDIKREAIKSTDESFDHAFET